MSNKELGANKSFLFISDPIDMPTGVAGQTLMLSLALRAKGHHVLNLAAYPPDVPIDKIPYRYMNNDGKWVIASETYPTLDGLLLSGALAMVPCRGFNDQQRIAAIIQQCRGILGTHPEVVIITDPRFYQGFWPFAQHLRSSGIPVHYWHVWDNGPTPVYNEYLGEVVDTLCCISKTTQQGLEQVVRDRSKVFYVPHGLDPSGPFVPIVSDEVQRAALRKQHFGKTFTNKTVFLWDNKNFWRKMPGHLLFAFSLAIKDDPNIVLVMKTSALPQSAEVGQDLVQIAHQLKLNIGTDVVFIDKDVDFRQLNEIYNAADVTINISHSEGFGLSTLCSMFAGTPIIANATGGLRDQLGLPTIYEDGGLELLDGVVECKNGQGWAIWPANRNITGSPPAPYIYEEHASLNGVRMAMIIAAKAMRERGVTKRMQAREFAVNNFNIANVTEAFLNATQRDNIVSSVKQLTFSMPLDAKENCAAVSGIVDRKHLTA